MSYTRKTASKSGTETRFLLLTLVGKARSKYIIYDDEPSSQLSETESKGSHSPELSTVFEHCQRPHVGTSGKPVTLRANMFPLMFSDIVIYHYEVTFSNEMKSSSLLRRIMSHAEAYSDLASYKPIFDGHKHLYTVRPIASCPLVISLKDTSSLVDEKLKGILSVSEISLHDVTEFLAGKSKSQPRGQLQVLDIAMRHQSSIRYFPLGRSFFYPDALPMTRSLSGGADVWLGHFQTVRPCQGGLMLNIDSAAVVMLEPGPLLEHVCKRMFPQLRSPAQITRQHERQLLRILKGLRVSVIHRPSSNRKYRIVDIAAVSAANDTFILPDGSSISVAQYFADKYKHPLLFPQLPCVKVGAYRISFPMELCVVVKGQREKRMLSAMQRTKMLEETCQMPAERANHICQAIPDASDDPYMKEFGIACQRGMCNIKGRVLNAPLLAYLDEQNPVPSFVDPHHGTWSLKDKKLLLTVPLTRCAAFILGNEVDIPIKLCETFIANLMKTAIMKGIPFERPRLIRIKIQQATQALHSICDSQSPPQLLFFFLVSDKEPFYCEIKRLSETVLGIPSQCVDCNKLRDRKKAGLGGANHAISPSLPIVSVEPTLVCGSDVHHPPLGNQTSPSLASVVGSYDRNASKYYTVVRVQQHRQEIIADLQDAIKRLLINFYRMTSRKPVSIIMYRNAFGETGFENILQHEMESILAACRGLDVNYRPKITYILVQKRNHLRLFPEPQSADRTGNMIPGTVVDNQICHPYDFDFFMCSHAGLKGTSKPTHYRVLYDASQFGADQLQLLTFSLCHLYARCTRSVSIPAPAYYAYLAAYRARLYTGKEAMLDLEDTNESCMFEVKEELADKIYYA